MIFRIFFSPFSRSAGHAAERGKTKSANAEVFTTLQTTPTDSLVVVLAESEIFFIGFVCLSRVPGETDKAIDPVNPVNPVEYKMVWFNHGTQRQTLD
jgi:hypothetical protein